MKWFKNYQMALELGYENYVQLGYDRMAKTDYGQKLKNIVIKFMK